MQKKHIDTTLVFLVLWLVIFGMVMISSVSVYSSFKVTSGMVAKWVLDEANNYFYLLRNITHVLMGVMMLVIASKIPYTLYEKYAKNIFALTLILLIVVLFVGVRLNGARGWLDIPGISFWLQPVEFMKPALILVLAYFMKKKRFLLWNLTEGFLPFFSIVGSVFFLLALQPDFGSILIIAPITIALYYIGWGNTRYIGISFAVCLVGALSVYGIGKIPFENGKWENINPVKYISNRIDNFMSNNKNAISNNTINYQTKQWLIAIGSGGFFGLGFGKSIQKFGYLPEVQWDFIFSVIIEELGFFWACLLILMYMSIGYKWYTIARSVKDIFGQYVAFGITTLILVQTFVNMWVNLNIIPLTWVTLPFVSYGGSSLFSLMISVGILLSISRHAEYRPTKITDIFSWNRRVSL